MLLQRDKPITHDEEDEEEDDDDEPVCNGRNATIEHPLVYGNGITH